MPKSPNQKLKLLYLMKLFLEKSDEKHPLSINDMIKELEAYDVGAERKSLYDDIEALKRFGMDIVHTKMKPAGYYLGSREFELPELKLLVDSVQSSKFITHKKTLTLIKKIESLASVYDAQLLSRQVYVRGRVKSMNESVYYNVDEISSAISQNKEIQFKYFEYSVSKERRFRKDGGLCTVSPFALMWDDENYYMLAFDDGAGKMKHYRVDKMAQISVSEEKRKGIEVFEKTDMSSYSQRVFGMFTGTEQKVKLRFVNHLVGAVIDRFGKDIIIIADGSEHFTVTIDAAVSPQFFAWVFGFGDEVEVISPESVRQEMRNIASNVLNIYK